MCVDSIISLYLCARCRDISFIFIRPSKARDADVPFLKKLILIFVAFSLSLSLSLRIPTHKPTHTHVSTMPRGDGNLFNGKLSTDSGGALRSSPVNPSVNRFQIKYAYYIYLPRRGLGAVPQRPIIYF